MRRIELPSEKLASELQRHLQDKRYRGSIEDGSRNVIEFEDMSLSQWIGLTSTVEKWARGRQYEVIQTLELRAVAVEPRQDEVQRKAIEVEVKKKVDALSPQTAEERYNYLSSKPISELTEEEAEERLALAQKNLDKSK